MSESGSDWDTSSRPSTASSRRQLLARKRSAAKKGQQGLIMSTGNKPRRPLSSAGRRLSSSGQAAEDDALLPAQKEAAPPQAAEISPIAPADVEEMELVEPAQSGGNKKSIFEKKLELSGLEQTYDPKDRRWKEKPGDQESAAPKGDDQPLFHSTTDLPDDFVFRPAPEGKKVMCRIVRDKSTVDKSVFPTYLLFLESPEGKLSERPVLAARKRKKAASSYYVISTNPEDLSRSSENFTAKLRANVVGTQFTLYDSGVNPAKCQQPENLGRPLREELVSTHYETNVLGFKGPRKMTVVMPTVKEGTMERNKVQPSSEAESLYRRNKAGDTRDLMILHNKKPEWNEAGNSYVLNFGGRVTLPSVKNFQIVHKSDTNYIVLQFGRVEEHEFTMDFQYPMCALQAFGVCLTSFDGKLAVE